MSLELFLYLIDMLASFGKLMILFSLISFLVSLCFFVVMSAILVDGDTSDDALMVKIRMWFKYFFIAFIFSSVLSCVIPSSKTMYMIGGVHVLKETKIPQKVEQLINKKLDEFLNEKSK